MPSRRDKGVSAHSDVVGLRGAGLVSACSDPLWLAKRTLHTLKRDVYTLKRAQEAQGP